MKPGVHFEGYRSDPSEMITGRASRGDHAEPSLPPPLVANPDEPVAITMTRAEWHAVMRALYAGMVESQITDEMGIALEERIMAALRPV